MEDLKLREIIDRVDDKDLRKLNHDLSNGGLHIKQLVENKIKERDNAKLGLCATCGKEFCQDENDYTLHFGSGYMRKKASFCEVDCLEYFLRTIKQAKQDLMIRQARE